MSALCLMSCQFQLVIKWEKKLRLKRRVKYLTIFGTAHYMYVPTLSFTSIEYALKNFGVTEIYEIFVKLQVDWS